MSRVSRLVQTRAAPGGNGLAVSGVTSHLGTHHLTYSRKQSSSPNQPQPQPPPPPSPAALSTPPHRGSSSSSNPTLLLVFVAVAAVVFASGLLHLLIRFLRKRRRLAGGDGSADLSSGSRRSPSAIQRQLQQLFTLHDAGGLDQASIDALPEFVYTELRGAAAADGSPGEPLDCAVCLCEFSPTDRLRLLPACGHAFHLACIDAWLTSSSTCPLCRGAAISLQDAEFDLDDDWRDLEEAAGGGIDDEKVVFPVRLGKFRSVQGTGAAAGAVVVAHVKQGPGNDNHSANDDGGAITKEEGEATTSSCGWKIDERRCYSMGSYQYVLRESALRLPLSTCGRDGGRGSRRRPGIEGRRLSVVAKGESFSVSKIWQWSNNKGQYPFPAVPSNAAPLDERFSHTIQERPEGR